MFRKLKNKFNAFKEFLREKKSVNNYNLINVINNKIYSLILNNNNNNNNDNNINWNHIINIINNNNDSNNNIKIFLLEGCKIKSSNIVNDISYEEYGNELNLDVLLNLSYDINQWCQQSPDNIAIYIPKYKADIIAGCILLMCKRVNNALDGVNQFRTQSKNRIWSEIERRRFSSCDVKFLNDFTMLVNNNNIIPNQSPPIMKLLRVKLNHLPSMNLVGCRLLLSITQGYRFLYSSFQQGLGTIYVPPNENEIIIDIGCNISGEAKLKGYHVPPQVSTDTPRILLFTVSFNTLVSAAYDHHKLKYKKDELDSSVPHKLGHNFSVTLDFETVQEEKEEEEEIKCDTQLSTINIKSTTTINISDDDDNNNNNNNDDKKSSRSSSEDIRSPSPNIDDEILISPASPTINDEIRISSANDDDDSSNDTPTNEQISSSTTTTSNTTNQNWNQEDIDLMMARALQMQFDREVNNNRLERRASAPANVGNTNIPTFDADTLLAIQLQAQLDDEENELFHNNNNNNNNNDNNNNNNNNEFLLRSAIVPSSDPRPETSRRFIPRSNHNNNDNRSHIRALDSASILFELLNHGHSNISRRSFSRRRHRSRSAGARMISLLPEFKCTGGKFLNEECQICRETFEIDEMLRTLPCIHSYHRSCIDRWLLESHTCPVCNSSILQNN